MVPLDFDRDSSVITLVDPADANLLAASSSVLVIDSSVHSGTAMTAAVTAIHDLGVVNVMTYSLILKRGASFIPNFFALIIDDHDRAFFLLQSIPNNRMMSQGVVRRLTQQDVHRTDSHLNAGVASIDGITWADLQYDAVTKSNLVYVYEHKKRICGFISFNGKVGKHVFVDAVAVDKSCHKQGIGGHLMRWAETWARSANCYSMELWAINNRIDFYTGLGYKPTGRLMDLGSEKYTQMQRKLLYNLNSPESDER